MMRTISRKYRFRFKYLFFALLLAYIIMCQSCMTMRMTPKETKTYFDTSKIAYLSKTFAVDKHKLHYIETGNPQNPTLLFIHGSPGSWDAYKRYLTDSLLLKRFRMIAIDRPGFGYSDFGSAEDLETQAKIIEAFIDSIDNHQPIILVGHSLGGPVAVKLAVDEPQNFKHLVILAGAVDPRMETAENWRLIFMAKPIRYLVPGAFRPANDELWWLKEDLYELRPKLKNISCDVTIIHGTKDPLVPFGNVEFMQKRFVNARSINVIAIENANHFIPWEHYDLIRNTLSQIKL
jgi:pimeloyl-ACP methyl ester carboxylesterase